MLTWLLNSSAHEKQTEVSLVTTDLTNIDTQDYGGSISYAGTCQKDPCFHYGKPPATGESTGRNKIQEWPWRYLQRCGVFVFKSAPSYKPTTLLVSQLWPWDQRSVNAAPGPPSQTRGPFGTMLWTMLPPKSLRSQKQSSNLIFLNSILVSKETI